MQEDLIYDVGLHKGEDSEFYLRKGFRVIAIEASTALCDIARRRLQKYVDSGHLTILNVAVATKQGPVKFFECEESIWGTISPERAKLNEWLGAKSAEVIVEGIDFGQVLRQYGIPYYLKVDVEGADRLCLAALQAFKVKPKFISIESSKTSWKELRGEFALLRKLGYSKFKVIQQQEVPAQMCPFPSREGRYLEHRFEPGASGLFGEEAPGCWMSEKEALRKYRRIFLRYCLFGDRGLIYLSRLDRVFFRRRKPKVGWYDTHAAAY